MRKLSYKTRVGISIGLFFASIGFLVAAICLSQIGYIWTAYVGPILAAISFVLFVVIMPKTNEDGSPIEPNKANKKKNVSHNDIKTKKPLLNGKEWKEQEDEDDEMIFIEEIVEDD